MRKSARAQGIDPRPRTGFDGRSGGQDRGLTRRERNRLDRRLREAAHDGDEKGVKRLLDLGADANGHDRKDRTALMEAASNGHDVIASLLLAGGASIYAKDTNDETARVMALKNNHPGILRMLELADGYDAYD